MIELSTIVTSITIDMHHYLLDQLMLGTYYACLTSCCMQVISSWHFDWRYMVRGLTIDKQRGNILKIDRHKYVKVAYHGFQELSREERRAIYSHTNVSATYHPNMALSLWCWCKRRHVNSMWKLCITHRPCVGQVCCHSYELTLSAIGWMWIFTDGSQEQHMPFIHTRPVLLSARFAVCASSCLVICVFTLSGLLLPSLF